MKATAACLTIAGAAGLFAQAVPSGSGRASTVEPPRLLVTIVVDQMRADYIALYGHQWTKGLRRLVDESANFPLAAYPYSGTLTCAGHSTISTGTFPATHGMIANSWYSREERRNVACTDDQTVTSVPFGGRTGREHHSPARLKVQTLADELRLQAARTPTIVAISLKARSALTLAGQPSPSTYAIWEEDDGTFATSSAYAKAPWPVVDEYARAHPVSAAYGQLWTRARPETTYLFSDAGAGELPPAEFPHALVSKAGVPDVEFANKWERSPLSDRYLGQLGQLMVRSLKLGQAPGTDLLTLSFSAVDLVGHEYGPRSHEVQDTLINLDETIGQVLDTLDELVGRDRYVVALSADHGVMQIPEQVRQGGVPAGRFTYVSVRAAIATALTPIVGDGVLVDAVTESNVYLRPGLLQRILATPGAREAVTRAITGIDGIERVYWADELASTVPTDDAFLRATRLSYVRERSGDLVIIPAANWIARSATGTTHGTPNLYDQRVPLLLMGAGIRPGRYLGPATPADIAPTLAHLAGITLSRTDGVVLAAAIK